jgi:hypothetical protein
MPVHTNAEEPLAHCLKGSHLLDVFGLRCWSCSPYANITPRMNWPAGTEKPHSWKATNDTTYPLGGRGTDSSAGTIHSMASVRGGSWTASTRRRSYSWETVERAQLNIVPVKCWASRERERRRQCEGERTRSSRGKREGEEMRTESEVPDQCSTHGFKGDRPDSSSSALGPLCQQDFRPLTPASRRNSRTQPRHLDSRDVQTCRD